jgi:hypothetical protein
VRTLTVAFGEARQRLREPGFLILLVALAALATYLAPAAGSPYSTLSLGRSGIYGGSALAGTTSGMDFAVFSGFFCIFALGSGFARDDRTRLSELLRAQPIRTLTLVLGRVLSSWMLGATIALGGMALLGITLVFREGAAFEAVPYVRNFTLLALPGIFVVASLAVILDVLLGKWRGALVAAGLVGYIVMLSLAAPGAGEHGARKPGLDFAGIQAVQTEFSHTFGPNALVSGGLLVEDHPGKPIFWAGLVPTSETVASRAVVVVEAALLGLLALAFYRRRAGTNVKGAQAIEPRHAGSYAWTAITIPVARARGMAGRIATEVMFRVRKNPMLAIASAMLFVLAIVGARHGHHWVVAGAILLPLFWIRAFDDALRPRSLDEALASLPGGLVADWTAKFVTLALLCCLPLAGLLIGNPQEPMVWAAATLGLLVEIAWLTAVTWIFRAELLAIGVVALLWYVVAFNNVPPLDYAGLWSVSTVALFIDAIVAWALIATSQTLLRRRA